MSIQRSEFAVHLLNDRGLAKATDVADILSEALSRIETHVPPGRERSIVVTKMQEACFFAKRGIALDPDNLKA